MQQSYSLSILNTAIFSLPFQLRALFASQRALNLLVVARSFFGLPISTMDLCSMTTTLSKSTMVSRRWATEMTVCCLKRVSMIFLTTSSVFASTLRTVSKPSCIIV